MKTLRAIYPYDLNDRSRKHQKPLKNKKTLGTIMSAHNLISPDVISLLLINILNQENNPAVIYKLSKTTCKILKYKETIQYILTKKYYSFSILISVTVQAQPSAIIIISTLLKEISE